MRRTDATAIEQVAPLAPSTGTPMRDALSKVLESSSLVNSEESVDRILAAAFFRKRPLQAGSSAHVVLLAERRNTGPREG